MSTLDTVSIVLVHPRVPENIGSAVRVACNFGITSIILVREEMPERERMAKTATHNTAHLLDTMPRFTSVEEALADFQLVAGTTARRGRKRFAERNPRQAAQWLRPRMQNNKTAILFGPEDTGLTNEELKYCQLVSAIPTAGFSSLNLAQAVAIHCYELYNEIACNANPLTPAVKRANTHEMESMYRCLEEALYAIDFLDKEGRPRWMANIRNFLARMEFEARDASLVRSICKKFLQSGENRRQGK